MCFLKKINSKDKLSSHVAEKNINIIFVPKFWYHRSVARPDYLVFSCSYNESFRYTFVITLNNNKDGILIYNDM